jgi:cytochrome c-type biogenesis protein
MNGLSPTLLWSSLAGGLLTFFSPCILPLVPLYLGYCSNNAIGSSSKQVGRRLVGVRTLLFVAGFIITFVAIGLLSSSLGAWIAWYRPLLRHVMAIVFIALGLSMLGILDFSSFQVDRRFRLSPALEKGRLGAFLLGFCFAAAWTPCIGPVLALILYLAGQQHVVWQGGLLLFLYGLGLAIPFLVMGLFFEQLSPLVSKLGRFTIWIRYSVAIILIISGLALWRDRLFIFA